jgi:uncharacterized protein
MVVVENFGSCNMRCTYCFPEHMWQRQGHQGVTTEATYRQVLETVFSTTGEPTVDVHLAGGEPLLAGRAWLEMALRVGREIAARHGKQATFSLQTNATKVTPELARFLADNRVHVGVSLDGPPELNEATRGHTEGTLHGYRLLTEAFGAAPGVIVTVTRCNARRMPEVIDYLEELGVRHFRANQMGATASWNAHAAPRAEDWAAARQAILTELAARRGRIMEVNVVESVKKLVRTLLADASPFEAGNGCCDIRCSAGRQLMYFDQRGNAYPCPRANVTPEAMIGNAFAPDFLARWEAAVRRLDTAMAVADECRSCPAQIVCDYGCHAWNVAPGNFFEVNCDATKDFYAYAIECLDEAARVFVYDAWRERLSDEERMAAIEQGLDLAPRFVANLAAQLSQKLDQRRERAAWQPALLGRRFGWRDEVIPVATITRPRVSAPLGRAREEGGV